MDANQLLELDFDTLHRLNGGQFTRMLKKLLLNVKQDMENRPSEKRSRTVTIKLKLRPKTVRETNPLTDREEDLLVGAGVALEWAVGIPTRKTQEIDIGFGVDGEMLVNPECLHNHRQQVLPAFVDEADTLQMTDRRSASVGS